MKILQNKILSDTTTNLDLLLWKKVHQMHEVLAGYIETHYKNDKLLGEEPLSIRDEAFFVRCMVKFTKEMGLVKAFVFAADYVYGSKLSSAADKTFIEKTLKEIRLNELDKKADIDKLIASRRNPTTIMGAFTDTRITRDALVWNMLTRNAPGQIRQELFRVEEYFEKNSPEYKIMAIKSILKHNPKLAEYYTCTIAAETNREFEKSGVVKPLNIPEKMPCIEITFSQDAIAFIEKIKTSEIEKLKKLKISELIENAKQNSFEEKAIHRFIRDGKEYVRVGWIEIPVREKFVEHYMYKEEYAQHLKEIYVQLEKSLKGSAEKVVDSPILKQRVFQELANFFNDNTCEILSKKYSAEEYSDLKQILCDEAYSQLFVPGPEAELEELAEQIPHLEALAASMQLGIPYYMIGDTGAGKTALITYIAYLTQRPLRRFNASGSTEKTDYIGKIDPYADKDDPFKVKLKWIDGMLTEAVRLGHIFYFDEINLAPGSVYTKLHALMDDDQMLVITENARNETIYASKGFWLCAASNKSSDSGREKIGSDLLSRFVWRVIEELSAEGLVKLLSKRTKLAGDLIMKAVQFYTGMRLECERSNFASKSPESLWYTIRNLKRFVKRLERKMDENGQVPEKNIIQEAYEVFGELLLDSVQQAVFWDKIKIIFGIDAKELPKEQLQLEEDASAGIVKLGEESFTIQTPEDPELKAKIPKQRAVHVQTFLRNLQKVGKSLELNEVLLMVGERATSKSTLVREYCRLTKNAYMRVNVDGSYDIEDFIGSQTMTEHGLEFNEAVLVEALRKGYIIVFDEVNTMRPEILERINSILDDAHCLIISEDNNRIVQPASTSRIVFTINPSKSKKYNRRKLSRPFVNKCHVIWVGDDYTADERIQIMFEVSKLMGFAALTGIVIDRGL